MLGIRERLRDVINVLIRNFEYLGEWWPYEESKEEIIVTAILTQNTSWSRVEKGFFELKRFLGSVKVDTIAFLDVKELEEIFRNLGFFRSKAKTLKDVCFLIVKKYGGFLGCLSASLEELRSDLLSVKGIGEETADSILLYAFDKPSFVVDNYTIRILNRFLHFNFEKNKDYDYVKRSVEEIVYDVSKMKILHGAFVEVGKSFCKSKKLFCSDCPLRNGCYTGLVLI